MLAAAQASTAEGFAGSFMAGFSAPAVMVGASERAFGGCLPAQPYYEPAADEPQGNSSGALAPPFTLCMGRSNGTQYEQVGTTAAHMGGWARAVSGWAWGASARVHGAVHACVSRRPNADGYVCNGRHSTPWTRPRLPSPCRVARRT